MIIGISGKKGSGKDTVADIITERTGGFTRHFAEPLKSSCRYLFGLSREQTNGPLKEVVDDRWGKTPREILQKFGTEVGRNIHDQVWVRATLDPLKSIDHDGTVVAITDTRFKGEADAIRAMGGIVIRIERPGLVPNEFSQHQSETDLDDYAFDYTIVNDGDLEQLEELVVNVLVSVGLVSVWPPPDREEILEAIVAERARQDAKFGEQNHPDARQGPLAKGSALAVAHANQARDACNADFASGRPSWEVVLAEEVFEAFAEAALGDVPALREELIQVAAVAVAWIEAIDRRVT